MDFKLNERIYRIKEYKERIRELKSNNETLKDFLTKKMVQHISDVSENESQKYWRNLKYT